MTSTAPAAESAPQQQQPQKLLQTEQEIVEAYNRLRQDQGTLMTRIAELDAERHDHVLVLSELKVLEGSRRCHRLVGGVLVERTVDTVVPEVEQALAGIDNVLKNFNDQLQRKEKEMEQFMTTYKISIKGGAQKPAAAAAAKAEGDASRGVLA
mmetsp:Transcript_15190/g.17546  ORF Transcript_15190/g.17546 Transcript_15190/m.17546 type:complete len:153 (+) Transcript_15190:42-500(+)